MAGFGPESHPRVAVRERILKLYDQGRGTAEIAARFGSCVAAVRRVRQHFKARGTLKPQPHRRGRKTHLTESRKERLRGLLARRPDATLAELGAQLARPHFHPGPVAGQAGLEL